MILTGTFESSSSSAKYSTQYDTSTGKGTCNCPGWTKRAVRECKHTKLLAKDSGECKTPATCGVSHKTQLPADPFQGFREPPAVKPMLASAMKADQSLEDFINDEWVWEEKFDGHRLLLVVSKNKTVTGWSRPGHERPSAERKLPQYIVSDAAQLPSGIYDGELRIPGGTSSDVVRLDLQDKLVLTLFDVIEVSGANVTKLPLWQRREMLEIAVAHVKAEYHHNCSRPCDGCAPRSIGIAEQGSMNLFDVLGIWKRGGEGAILKRKASKYQSGWRTPDWVKIKQIDADELTITGFEEGKMGPQSIFKLRHDDGRETSVKILTNDLLRAVAKSPKSYVGRRVTISYTGLTTTGLFRHPVLDHIL